MYNGIQDIPFNAQKSKPEVEIKRSVQDQPKRKEINLSDLKKALDESLRKNEQPYKDSASRVSEVLPIKNNSEADNKGVDLNSVIKSEEK